MASPNENDDVPMLPVSNKSSSASRTSLFTSNSRSISLANTSSTIDVFDSSTVFLGYTDPVGFQRRSFVQMSDPLSSTPSREPLFSLPLPNTGGSSDSVGVSSSQPGYHSSATPEQENSDDELVSKHEHLLRSGKLGMCNDPYCTTCPTEYNREAAQIPKPRVSATSNSTFQNALDDDAKGWAKRFAISVNKYLPPIMNPHSRVVQSWTTFFSVSFFLSIFVDPLWIFLTLVKQNNKCIMIDSRMANVFVTFRSVTDLVFYVNMLFQFRIAYVTPESEVYQMVDDPAKIAGRYFRGKFRLDFFMVMPLPQILILWIMPAQLGFAEINAYILFYAAVVIQYILKLYTITPAEFIFESASKFATNFLSFMLVGHVVGSCWYFFGLQKVKRCLLDACGNSDHACRKLIDCSRGSSNVALNAWRENASACFQEDGYHYGIYLKTVNLTNQASLITRYSYSLFWGIQQISTLAGNQVPSYSLSEIFFTMTIVILGLLLFAFLIGHMQNYLLAVGRRNLEMTMRKHEAEQWMSRRRFPEGIRRRVRRNEKFNWEVTKGVNEELLFGSMPDDLQRDIRRHLFIFLKKVRIFSLMNDTLLDIIREKLKLRTYMRGSTVLHSGYLVETMVFIVTGTMASIGEDGSVLHLSEGDVCGEEILIWCFEQFSLNHGTTLTRLPSKGLLSNRDVMCLTNVDAFLLSVADLEEVRGFFSGFLRRPRVQASIRYESPYWRLRAARKIQVAWRYRRRRLKRL
ncbi:unnamed protein product [Brassica oleracea var. botrytis]